MAAAVPMVEVADDADALGVGRQHDKGRAGDAFERHRVSAELVIDLQVRAFAQQKQVESDRTGGKRYTSSNSTVSPFHCARNL